VTRSPGPGVPEPEIEPEIESAAIAAEIGALRRGRGLRGDVADRIGPLLREFAAAGRPPEAMLPGGPDAAQAVAQLARKLSDTATRLAEDLRKAVLAALALQPETRDMPTYEERRDWLAGQINRGPRTAERRIDTAQKLLGQQIASALVRQRSRPSPLAEADRWHITRFGAVLYLDGDYPEAVETRRIVAGTDGLSELAVALDLPVDRGEERLRLTLEMISGGELVQVEDVALTRTRFVIRLPRPLEAGESHEYRVRVRVLPGGPMRDYYVFRPERRCDEFDVRVRFHRGRVPAWVRRVDGEDVYIYNSFAGPPKPAELVAVDETGEAVQSFRQLAPHFGFGLQWGWTW
jgi:hypothetical protein